MRFTQGVEMFSQIIEVLKSEVEDIDSREAIYEEFIKIWKEHGCDNLESCLNEDPVFDKFFEDDEVEEGSYDDSWGGDQL